MKKFFLLTFLLSLFVGCGTTQETLVKTTQNTSTQEVKKTIETIPQDKDVIVGKLDNGLTYYIRHNAKPEKKVELRLAVNAGSILEDDDQQGLAHFMEHMNFNGLKHFPKNKLVDYLQSIGVRFGADLNAYTSFDQTVYMLPIPLDDPKNLEGGLTVIHDWAYFANLTGEEIDKERGVVLEEYRLGLGADKRMMAKWLPVALKGSKYAERLPIGKKNILENFKYETLRRFHKDWYRPDLEAVIVVGDINPEEIEKKIKTLFADIPKAENPRKRKTFYIPNHEGTVISIAADKEAGMNNVRIEYRDKEDFKQDNSVKQYRDGIVEGLFSAIIRNRLKDLADNSDNPPYSFAFAYHGSSIGRTKQAYTAIAYTDADKKIDALKALLRENKKALLFGFSQAELDRAKKSRLARYEQYLNNKNTEESSRIVGQYIRNFLENEPIPSIEWEYNMHKKTLPEITLAEVNALAKKFIHKDNRTIIITGIDKKGEALITEAQVQKAIDDVDNEKLTKSVDTKVASSLLDQKLKAGKIVKEEKNADLGTTTLYLDNGAKVVYKKTDFKNDEVKMMAFKFGGKSLFDTNLLKKVNFALSAVPDGGVNGFKKSDLRKILAGKNANVRMYFGANDLSISGSARPKDLELMFQQLYLNQTKINKDEKAYASWKMRQAAFLGNLGNMPQYKFMLAFSDFTNQNNPRYVSPIPTKELLDAQDYDSAYDNFTKYFSSANDFYYYFVGNFDEAQLREYVKTYIGAIPNKNVTGKYKKYPDYSLKGFKEFVYKAGKDPKSSVSIIYHGKAKATAKQKMYIKALGEILTNKLIERIREKESGVYGVGARGSINKIPVEKYNFRISFPCGPDNSRKLIASTMDEINKLINEGPSEKDLKKIKTEWKIQFKEKLKQNDFWLDYLSDNDYVNADPKRYKEYLDAVEKMTTKDIQQAAVTYLKNAKNRIIGIWYPEGYTEKK
jgi:zinc protease